MGLKTRIIPVLLWAEHGCVKGKQFNPGRCIGSIADRIRLLERRNVDELIILDISATPNGRGPRFEQVAELTADLFMPVTVGGGVKNISDIRRLLASGADKVAINTAAVSSLGLIKDAAQIFGSQAIVVSIDVKNGCVYTHCGKINTTLYPVEWAQRVQDLGAGEILLTSIDRDGMMNGYDLELINSVTDAVSIPVIVAGGCGSYEDMANVMTWTKAHAVAAGAMFQFAEQTPKGASRYLHEQGIPTRL